MYVGSAEFRAANDKPVQKHRISGTIDGIAFTPNNLLQGSVTVTNQCSDSSDAKIGAVFIGQLKCTFLPNIGIAEQTWQGREIVLNFSLLTQEVPEVWETFSLGKYIVSSAERTLQGFVITAYDYMSKFDKPCSWDYLPNGSVYSILNDICNKCGVQLGVSSADCTALPNGNMSIGLYPGSDVKTYRDILYWLSQTVAGFCTMDRLGRLVIKSYKTILEAAGDVPELPQDKRLTSAKISDYTTDFCGVYLFNMKDQTTHYYGSTGQGVRYDLGQNPFLQYGTAAQITTMAHLIRYAIAYDLRPFQASIMSAPIWELGDRIKLTGGIATGYDTVTVIHSINYTAGKGMTLQCFGANPAIVASGTQNKAAGSAEKSAQMQTTSYKRYANNSNITVNSTPQKVVEVTFTAEKNTDFEVWHEILLKSALGTGSPAVELTAVYYLDGDELVRKPVETYTDNNKHILTLQYSEAVTEGNHIWEVYLEASGGTASINTSDAIAVLKGQGLAKAETWDGIIIVDDNVEPVPITMDVATVSESYTLTLPDPVLIQLSETLNASDIDMHHSTITATYNLTMYQPGYPIEEEEGTDILATETGDYYIETE